MSLFKEATYIYIYSKELTRVNKKIKNLSKKADKHYKKHQESKEEKEKHKHRKKHLSTVDDITSLIKKHNNVMKSLKHHLLNYHHSLKKEHKIN
jgi:hypothetical protein